VDNPLGIDRGMTDDEMREILSSCPAGPVSVLSPGITHCIDLTLLDYFAAHAPLPQWEFEVQGLPPRPEALCNKGEAQTVERFREMTSWDRAHAVAKAKQWPYEWAKAMMEERERVMAKVT
jgi:hypothetical protein